MSDQQHGPGDPARDAAIFRAICDTAPVGLFFTDADGLNVYTNPVNLRQMGLSSGEALGTGWQRAIHPEDREQVFASFAEAVQRERIYRGTNRYLRADGTIVEVAVKAAAFTAPDGSVGFVGAAEDVTEEEQRHKQRARAARMESIGRFAGGVAHDFNNLLTVIMGFAEVVPSAPEWAAEEILRAAERGSELTSQLLAFARRQPTQPVLVDPVTALEEMRSTVRRLLPASIELSMTGGGDTGWNVLIDPTQFQQVILNLAVNARDAMPAGGDLTIEVAEVVVEGGASLSHDEIEPGEYVRTTVSDTGDGMSEETIGRIFEPFYTTKGDAGSGLGLATCYGIVKHAQGSIWVDSEPGVGSSFKVFLPHVAVGAAARPLAPVRAVDPRGRETILLMEDEPSLGELLRQAFVSMGYTVLAATSGEEGVRLGERAAHVDAIVTDVVLPALHGPEAAAQIMERHPRAVVLYTSGYDEHGLLTEEAVQRGRAFIAKPFSPRSLVLRLRSLLDERDRSQQGT